jgi:hypothetical protein
VDCDNALVPAPIEIASVKDNPSFRMCQSFSLVSLISKAYPRREYLFRR